MNEKELGAFSDSVMQIYSMSTVCKDYTDNHYQEEEMLHVGIIVDKIHEQAFRLKEILEVNNLLP